MRICTWNIQLGRRLEAVVQAVKANSDFSGLDLFAVQEASIHDGREDASAIAEALGSEYRYSQATAQMIRGRDQGNALIWRRGVFEPTAPQVLTLSGGDSGQMTRAERTLLRAIPPQRRIAIRAESEAVRVYVIHLDVIGFTHKLEQFRAVISDMKAQPPVPLTLVAGDLNTFGPPRLQLWRRIRASARTAGVVEVTRSVRRTHWTAQKLDAIYAHANTALSYRAWALRVRGSDHLPVFAEIDLLGAGAQ
ncbi:MAG: hypothetical protein M3082_03190 [Candidatus Dormibacteraeota bacterium]|nr:hypothetical protein [Candidatus Dormibacteraeota bacterium]